MIPAALLAARTLPWKWIGIGLGTLAAVSIIWWRIDAYGDARYETGKGEVQQAWDKDARERERAYMALQASYRAQEQAWAAQAAKARQERANEDARTIAGLERTIAGLRHRPERPTVPGAAPAPGSDPATRYGTGAFLYRPDGEFLAREAARADRIRAALMECYSVVEGP